MLTHSMVSRFLSAALLLGLAAGCGSPVEGHAPLGTEEQAITSGFVTRAGTELRVGTDAFYFAGTNNYYLWYAPIDCIPSNDKCVKEILDDSVALGHTVIRTWGFADGGGAAGWDGYAFQPEPGVYDEPTFAHFDQVVAEAKARGLRFIIPLVNNWNDFGGMAQYVAWTGNGAHDDFYTRPACRTLYQNYISYFLNRINTVTGIAYKDEPTILAWELGNEPRAETAGVAVLDAWVGEMSAFIKSQDPNHLVGTGIEGFYNGRSGFSGYVYSGAQGTDFIANHAHPSIDLASMHMYPAPWQLSELDALEWLNVHIDDARHVLNKPVILGEFGHEATMAADIVTRDRLMTEWYAISSNKNAAGDMYWILYGDAYPDYDNLGIYYPADTSTVSIIQSHAAAMNAKTTQATVASELALVETTTYGTLSGTYLATRSADGVREVLTEVTSNGSPSTRFSRLEHTYRLWVTPGNPVFKVRAFHSVSSDGDHFKFQYSTDGIAFTDMLTVTKTADDGLYQTFALPTSVRERVWIKVVDTNRSPGTSAVDSLQIDHMLVEVSGIDVNTDSPPSVTVVAPSDGAAVNGLVPISATATDDQAVVSVDLSVDGGAYTPMTFSGGTSFSANWDATGQAQGSAHTLSIRATDDIGQISTESISVFVDNFPGDPDPTAVILSPASGGVVSGNVTVQVSATDDASVAAVEYRIDSGLYVPMSFVSGTQWSAIWNSTTVPDGNHLIQARSIDSSGQPSQLAGVTVRVANVASQIVHVHGITMSGKVYGQKRQALADVLIRELDGALVPNAAVTVVWSGASPPKTETVTTGSNGVASSFSNRGNPGTFVATVTNVSCSGCFYDSAANLETTDSITIP